MARIYYWKNNVVNVYTGSSNSHTVPEFMHNCFVIDTSETEPSLRYGKYVTETDTTWAFWEPVKYMYFPAEFKTWMLLLT